MTLSKDARWENVAQALLLLTDRTQHTSIMEVFIDEWMLGDEILPTTWDELKRRGLVRSASTGRYYTLSGDGWLAALKLKNELDTPEMKLKAGKLSSVRIPMMSISHSDLMPIRTERSDAGLSQCEIVIDIRQEFCWFSLS